MTVNLRLTGPTPLPPDAYAAMSRPMLSHRSAEFRAIHRRVTSDLQTVLGCSSPPLTFTCSGTGGLEAAVTNLFDIGDRVLVCSIGLFGERMLALARAFGLDVVGLERPWGQALDVDEVRAAVRATPGLRGVLLTHNETSTGVLNPLADLAAAVHEESDALLVVDAVSSAGAVELHADDWGLDAVVTASQKALMAPPGIAVVAVSEAAVAAAAANRRPRYYFDLARMLDAGHDGTTTYTPAVSTLFALESSLATIVEEGMPTVAKRHDSTAAGARARVASLGLRCFAADEVASPTVTAVVLPDGADASTVRAALAERHGVVVSQGRGPWKQRMVRIGHMGYVGPDEVLAAVDALGAVVGR